MSLITQDKIEKKIEELKYNIGMVRTADYDEVDFDDVEQVLKDFLSWYNSQLIEEIEREYEQLQWQMTQPLMGYPDTAIRAGFEKKRNLLPFKFIESLISKLKDQSLSGNE